MNRRTFFRSLLSAAACVVARAYAPGAASVGTPIYRDKFVWDLSPEPGASLIAQMHAAMERIRDEGPFYFYAHPDTIAKLRELALRPDVQRRLRKPNRWDRRQRRLASR